jgi:hypothetical protein
VANPPPRTYGVGGADSQGRLWLSSGQGLDSSSAPVFFQDMYVQQTRELDVEVYIRFSSLFYWVFVAASKLVLSSFRQQVVLGSRLPWHRSSEHRSLRILQSAFAVEQDAQSHRSGGGDRCASRKIVPSLWHFESEYSIAGHLDGTCCSVQL